MPKPLATALSGSLEEQDARGHTDVQALHLGRQRNRQAHVGFCCHLVRQAGGLAADEKGERAAKIRVLWSDAPPGHRGGRAKPTIMAEGHGLRGREAPQERKTERASHGSAEGFPPEGIGRAGGEERPRCAGAFRRTHETADIPRILDAHDHEDEGNLREERFRSGLWSFGDREDALRLLRGR